MTEGWLKLSRHQHDPNENSSVFVYSIPKKPFATSNLSSQVYIRFLEAYSESSIINVRTCLVGGLPDELKV